MSDGRTSGRVRLVSFGLLVATFLVGALSGAAVDRVLSANEPAPLERERDDDRRDGRRYVIDELDLTAEQRATIDAILDRRGDRMRDVWGQMRPRLNAITDSARAEIFQALTPEQRAEYERKLEERRRKRHDDRDADGR